MRAVIITETIRYRMDVFDEISDDKALDVFCEFTEEEMEGLEIDREISVTPE